MNVRHRHPHIPYLSLRFFSPEGKRLGIISLSPTHNKITTHENLLPFMSVAGNLLQKAFIL